MSHVSTWRCQMGATVNYARHHTMMSPAATGKSISLCPFIRTVLIEYIRVISNPISQFWYLCCKLLVLLEKKGILVHLQFRLMVSSSRRERFHLHKKRKFFSTRDKMRSDRRHWIWKLCSGGQKLKSSSCTAPTRSCNQRRGCPFRSEGMLSKSMNHKGESMD